MNSIPNQYEIYDFCNQLLCIDCFEDYCPNGLQIEGDSRVIQKIALGVSMSENMIQHSINWNADLILTHHGLLWNKDSRVIQKTIKRKIYLLLSQGISAGAYHLPLDCHMNIGNHIQLAKKINLKHAKGFYSQGNSFLGIKGEVDITIQELSEQIEAVLGRKPLVLNFGPQRIKQIGLITGAAQGYFEVAINEGIDCFITGEASEYNYSMSQESKVHFISAGHYHTEKYGIQALGKELEKVFDIETKFIEEENPI